METAQGKSTVVHLEYKQQDIFWVLQACGITKFLLLGWLCQGQLLSFLPRRWKCCQWLLQCWNSVQSPGKPRPALPSNQGEAHPGYLGWFFILFEREKKLQTCKGNTDLSKKSFIWPEEHNLQAEVSDADVFKRLREKKWKKTGEDSEENHKDDSQMWENPLQDLDNLTLVVASLPMARGWNEVILKSQTILQRTFPCL